MSKRPQKLKYIGVEMIKKDATKSTTPEVGLFRGFRVRSEDKTENPRTITLILLGVKDKENDIVALNTEIYNVLSIKMMYGDTKELIVLKHSNADQDAAKDILEEVVAEFKEQKRMVDNDPEIIDVGTFDDVPEEFFSPKKETKAAGSATTSNNYGYGGVYSHNTNSDWQKKQAEREAKKKEEEKMRWTPFLFKRKGELPGLKAMNAIKKKISQIGTEEWVETFKDPDPKDSFIDGKKTADAK